MEPVWECIIMVVVLMAMMMMVMVMKRKGISEGKKREEKRRWWSVITMYNVSLDGRGKGSKMKENERMKEKEKKERVKWKREEKESSSYPVVLVVLVDLLVLQWIPLGMRFHQGWSLILGHLCHLALPDGDPTIEWNWVVGTMIGNRNICQIQVRESSMEWHVMDVTSIVKEENR